MYFGKILKEIRTNNGNSLRSLSSKIGIIYLFIDRVERVLFLF